ncbi:MAG: protein kinase [Kofleriaceae bacterium]|nr:protein kinase [Kofleriaceae bacterium]
MSTSNKPPLPPTIITVADRLPWFDGTVELEEEALPATPPPVPKMAPEANHHRQIKPMHDEGEIARGGMGAIHKLYDPELRRSIAMKVLEPSSDVHAEQRFIDEARIIGLLEHPNIVPVHDLVVGEDGKPSYTMKLVSGSTLTELIARQKNVRDLENILNCLIKVCDALSFAHSRGIIHRDLKPDNIMIGSHGQVYLMDWGCAQVLSDTSDITDGRQDEDGMVIGTLAYMAPEQALGRISKIDARTDVFGVGAMLYKALTGTPPYSGTAMVALVMAQKAEVRPPEEATENSVKPPPQLSAIAMKAMAKSPEDRFQSVDDIAEELRAFLRGGNWFPLQTFAAGEVIVGEGDRADAAYIITKGQCEVRKAGSDTVLRILREGDVFGETAIFADTPRSASVIAIDEVSAVVVDRSSIEHITETSWLGMFVKALADRFLDVDSRLSDSLSKS